MTKDNRLLGKFELSGIPPGPRGGPQVEVAFDVDASGILQVSAVEKNSGKSQTITITSEKGRLSESEIERMVKEAEEFAEQDRVEKERVDAKNHLESLLFQIRHDLDDGLKGKLPQEEEDALKRAVEETQEWFDSHPGAEKEELVEKAGELEKAYIGAREKVPAAGGPGEGEDGSSQGEGAAEGPSEDEPKVEEVD